MNTPIRILALIFTLILLSACGSSADSVSSTTVVSDDQAEAADETSQDDEADHDDDDDHDLDEEGHEDEEVHDHDEDSSGLSAHEHGSAELAVASSGNDLIIDLISPTENIFGFEYEAATDEDKAIVEDRAEALTSTSVLVINPEAGCELSGDASSEVVTEGSHGEITVTWEFVCDTPDELDRIDLSSLFSEFPAIEDLDAEVATDDSQSSAELSPSATILELA